MGGGSVWHGGRGWRGQGEELSVQHKPQTASDTILQIIKQ
jgi:hypothetical protein